MLKVRGFAAMALLIMFTFTALGQSSDRMSTEEYIGKYSAVAVKKMKEYRIPASITLAQGILESGSGNSRLARKGNNHFGIKCHKDWKGKRIYEDDDEKHECFRKYRKAEDSYNDHSLFLTTRDRYAFLFNYDSDDYKKWAYGLKKAGYATNPKYPQLLIRIIEEYDLHKFDKGDSGKERRRKEKEELIADADVSLPPSVADYKKSYVNDKGRQVLENNRRKLVIIEKGDTFYGLAKEFEIYSWQLYKYNDLPRNHVLKVGEVIYLEKKRRKADRDHKLHRVMQGESMASISQVYGIRLKRLYKMNNMAEGVQPETGSLLKLR